MGRLHNTFCPDLPREETTDRIAIMAAGILRDDPDLFWRMARERSRSRSPRAVPAAPAAPDQETDQDVTADQELEILEGAAETIRDAGPPPD